MKKLIVDFLNSYSKNVPDGYLKCKMIILR